MTGGEPINPYAAPVTTSEAVTAEMILQGVLQSVPTLRFASEVTRADLRDALATTGMRSDLISKRTILTLLFVALTIWIVSLSGVDLLYVAFASFGIAAFFVAGRLLMLRRLVQAAAATLGPTEGEISVSGVSIRKPLQSIYYPLTSIVAVASNRRRVVFIYDQSLNHFETIKFTDFDNPLLAENMVTQLRGVLPPIPPVLIDERRQTVPMEYNHFRPGEQASFFEGPIHSDDLKGTTFERRLRQGLRGVWVRLTLYFSVVGIGLYMLFGQSFPLLVFGLVVLFLYGSVYRKLRAIRKTMLGKNEVLWQSRGWVEPQGFAHISAVGQSYSQWAMFAEPEVNEDSVVLKYRVAAMWMALSKKQFADPNQWPEVKQRIVDYCKNSP